MNPTYIHKDTHARRVSVNMQLPTSELPFAAQDGNVCLLCAAGRPPPAKCRRAKSRKSKGHLDVLLVSTCRILGLTLAVQPSSICCKNHLFPAKPGALTLHLLRLCQRVASAKKAGHRALKNKTHTCTTTPANFERLNNPPVAR
jgi:hypothetical protein